MRHTFRMADTCSPASLTRVSIARSSIRIAMPGDPGMRAGQRADQTDLSTLVEKIVLASRRRLARSAMGLR